MASFGLYDCDFWHGTTTVPNLELMKAFNYYYSCGDIVVFLSPQDSLARFNKVIFFKEYPSTRIPAKINLSCENGERYGYGFYHKFESLTEGQNSSPIYLPYEMKKDKIKNLRAFNKYKKGSLIRLENQDFSDFKKDSSSIYLVDFMANQMPAFEDFVLEHKKKYTIRFLKALSITSMEDFEKFFSIYQASGSLAYLNFCVTKDFFLKYYVDHFIVYPAPREECFEKDFYKMICMILYAKNDGKILSFKSPAINSVTTKTNPILKLYESVLSWALKGNESYFSFIKGDAELLKNFNGILANKDELRLALKQKPTKILLQELDF